METEIERMVVRLIGDGSSYQSMMQQAQVSTQQAASQVEAASKRIEGFAGGLKTFAAGAVSALGAIGASNWLREALGEWQNAESTALKLEAAIRANGRAVGPTMEAYRQFASQLQETTVLGDDTTLAMLRQAESFGLSGDAAMQAVRSAISLQAASHGTAEGAEGLLRITTALARGDNELAFQMRRTVPSLRLMTDESQFLAEAQRLIASGMATATAEAQSSAGQMKQLKNAYGDLMEEFGKDVDRALAPVKKMAMDIVKWFQSLSPEVKQTIVMVAMLAAGFVSLAAAIAVAGFVFNTLFGGAGILLGLLVAAGVAISAWVFSMGGIEESWQALKVAAMGAWDILKQIWPALLAATGPVGVALALIITYWDDIKEAVNNFMVWAKPIFKAIKGVIVAAFGAAVRGVEAVWGVVKTVFTKVKDFVLGVWQRIVGRSEVDWGAVKDTILELMIFAEFAFDNIGSFATLAWTGARLGFVVLKNVIAHFFSVAIPAYLNWFRGAWGRTFQAAFDVASTGFSSLGDVLTGNLSIGDFRRNLAASFRALGNAIPPIEVPLRIPDATEQQLRREFDALAGALRSSWEEFRRRRLAELGMPDPELLRRMEDNGNDLANATNRGVAKSMEKFDAVLHRSAEALFRIRDYMDRIAMPLGGVRPGGVAGMPGAAAPGVPAPAPARPIPVQQVQGAAPDPQQQATVTLLTSILEVLRLMARQGGGGLPGLNLPG